MAVLQTKWLHKFIPTPNHASGREQLRAGIGAIVALMLTALMSYFLRKGHSCMAFLVAPMGATSVLLAAPLAGGLAIVAMFLLRCLHPPGGAAHPAGAQYRRPGADRTDRRHA
ncbi:HPP family protein [Massilia sp. TWR1-2-2]|uniref:HPP family protein n=1 Tax=Massilia sp. TWR1-2-2 TaxID=2804584 RepID=UPI003CEE54CB